eukprot:scaffold2163_cov120-Isochrysis_galbana.AAC.2
MGVLLGRCFRGCAECRKILVQEPARLLWASGGHPRGQSRLIWVRQGPWVAWPDHWPEFWLLAREVSAAKDPFGSRRTPLYYHSFGCPLHHPPGFSKIRLNF